MMKQLSFAFSTILLLLLSVVAAQEATTEAAAGDEDECAALPVQNYQLSLRIGSIFILFATTTIGTFAPMIAYRINPHNRSDFRDYALNAGKFFGTGVILATAFVHMLPEAMENFGSPCLTVGWLSYGAFGGVFCMIASFALQLLEIISVTHINRLQKRHHHHKRGVVVKDVELGHSGVLSEKMNVEGEEQQQQQQPAHVATLVKDNASMNATTDEPDSNKVPAAVHHHIGDDHGHTHGILFENEDAYKHIGTYILELGIIMHSIIIGITLSNIETEQFITLLIALVFHQFFEGIALGTRLNEIPYKNPYKPFAFGFLYTVMTPIGAAIGIGIHASFNPNSYPSVLSSAILDSLSAGILLYNAYVSLMSMEMSHSAAFHGTSTSKKICSFLSMYIGAALMSVLGKWA